MLLITAEVDATTDRPNSYVVVDLHPVEFLDCYGLGLLCRARRRAEERGGHLTLVCPQPGIRRMIRIVGLSQVFVLTDTLDEALDGRTSVSKGAGPFDGGRWPSPTPGGGHPCLGTLERRLIRNSGGAG
ncbi:STAS domain-containing protein [Streptomyces sp. NBC_00989]|uniref:STAS domain-containing protein n=1 Tax=Streptomyces sp. NBC_00989 TaxID=2903705 RepID=UPI0038634A94|nr:STAS domain-containing protein [Streptomyces sp. NBC_00989]